jgi:phosphoribosyl 1,2-cyclic phosphodiesterase
MRLRFCLLSSGSDGNCAIVETDKTAVLIDFGRPASYIKESLATIHLDIKKISGVLITHMHTDHLSPAGFNFLIKNQIPIYFHKTVLDDVYERFGNKVDDCNAKIYDDKFEIGNICISPFDVYHKDSTVNKTLGFTLSAKVDGRIYKIGYITDTGKITEGIKKALSDSNILAIESNYNREMLDASDRPYENKKWVLSDYGHLANEDAAQAMCDIKDMSSTQDSLKYVFLAHISRLHNNGQTALKTAKDFMLNRKLNGINLFVAPNSRKSRSILIGR